MAKLSFLILLNFLFFIYFYILYKKFSVDILYAVENDGRINGKYIADLGCGCGFLLLGASRIGAS